ncbi:MAG: DUF3558 domain-containing protein [Labedaea sp.]
MKTLTTVVAVFLAGLLAGCTTTIGGQPGAVPDLPGASSGGRPTSTTSGAANGAPRVARPLDATRFLSRPCDALSPAQLATFGVSAPGTPTTTGAVAEYAGPFCTWHAAPEVNSTIGIGFLTGNKNGLSDTYRGRHDFGYFEETTVDGYPAVFAEGSDSRSTGACGITVGISDTLAFDALEQGNRKGQASCDRAKQVAAAVLATLKG